MILSVKFTCIFHTTLPNRCPIPECAACVQCAVLVQNVLIDYDILCEDSVGRCVRIGSVLFRVYKRRKPIQLTGVFDLIYAVDLFRLGVMAVVIPAETVVVPAMVAGLRIFIIGIGICLVAVCELVNCSVGAVQNRSRIGRLAVVQVLAESNVSRFAIVQQVGYFTAGELFGGFAKCAIIVVGFAVGEVVAVCECAFVVLTAHAADIRCACHFACVIAVVICAVIIAAYTADPFITYNISCVIAVFNCAVILANYAADISAATAIYYTSHICFAITIANCASFIIGTADAADVIATSKVRIF